MYVTVNGCAPNVTVVPEMKFIPVIVTWKLPVLMVFGLIAVIAGVGFQSVTSALAETVGSEVLLTWMLIGPEFIVDGAV